MRVKRFLLLVFVILSCTLIALNWSVNMTQQGADEVRSIVVATREVDEIIVATPSIQPLVTGEPESRPDPIPTLSDILEDQ